MTGGFVGAHKQLLQRIISKITDIICIIYIKRLGLRENAYLVMLKSICYKPSQAVKYDGNKTNYVLD